MICSPFADPALCCFVVLLCGRFVFWALLDATHPQQGVVAGDPRASYSARVDEWIAQNHASGAPAPAPSPPPAPPAPAARSGDKENAATSGGRHGGRPQLRAPFGLLPTEANTRSLGVAEWSSAASKAKAESKISAPGMSSA